MKLLNRCKKYIAGLGQVCTTDNNMYTIISHTHAPLQLCIVTPNHYLQMQQNASCIALHSLQQNIQAQIGIAMMPISTPTTPPAMLPPSVNYIAGKILIIQCPLLLYNAHITSSTS